MLTAALFLALAGIQPPSPQEDDAYVADPFDLDAEEPAAPQTAPAPSRAQASTPLRARDPDELICRSRPELGTRLRYLRVCLTVQEWELHETHMEQQRRDINDWGAQGGAAPR